MNSIELSSKLPAVGTTIFTVMTNMANEHKAINLSQGFPNFPASPELIDLVDFYMKKGMNQYSPLPGIKELRDSISEKIKFLNGIEYNPDTEITVTTGGTEALYSAIVAVVRKGDEVIIFEPAYDSYVPAIELNGGIPVYVSLIPPLYSVNWNEVENKINDKTRLIIINTPHNPTGRVFTSADWDNLAHIIKNKNIFIISDEVYEHIVFDNLEHKSVMTNETLRERSFIISSFGKTFHVTGWKTGYCVAPQKLTAEFRKIHQYLTFCTFTPGQFAFADFLKNRDHYLSLPSFYEQKRNIFLESVKNSRFEFLPSQGSYFQNLSFAKITDENDYEFAVRLTKEIGVASIPVSVFYNKKNDYKILRFCFAKDDETLQRAGGLLSKI